MRGLTLAALSLLVCYAQGAMLLELFSSGVVNCDEQPPILMAVLDVDVIPMALEECMAAQGCQHIDENNPLKAYLPLGYARVTCDVPSDTLLGDNLVDGYGALDISSAEGCPASSLEATAAIKLGICVKASSFPFDLSMVPQASLVKAIKATSCIAGQLTLSMYYDEVCGISLISYPAGLQCVKLPVPPMTIISLPTDQYVSVRCPGSETLAPTEAPCCCHSPPESPQCSLKSEFMCLLEGGQCGAHNAAPTGVSGTPQPTEVVGAPTPRPSTAEPTGRPTRKPTEAPTSPPTTAPSPSPTSAPPPTAHDVASSPTAAPSQKPSPVNGVLVAVVVILVLGIIGGAAFMFYRHRKARQVSAINEMDLGGMDVLDGDSDLDF